MGTGRSTPPVSKNFQLFLSLTPPLFQGESMCTFTVCSSESKNIEQKKGLLQLIQCLAGKLS